MFFEGGIDLPVGKAVPDEDEAAGISERARRDQRLFLSGTPPADEGEDLPPKHLEADGRTDECSDDYLEDVATGTRIDVRHRRRLEDEDHRHGEAEDPPDAAALLVHTFTFSLICLPSVFEPRAMRVNSKWDLTHSVTGPSSPMS
jgi:hypothetical protein